MYSNTVRQHSERKMSSDESYSCDEFYSSDQSRSSYSPFKLLVKPASAENTLVPEYWESTIGFWNNGVRVSGRSRCTSSNDTFECEPPATPLKDDASKNVLVKPASVENTLVPEYWESTISFWNNGVRVSGRSRCTSSNDTFECEPPATPLKDDASINFQSDDSTPVLHIFPSDIILVSPASAENTLVLEDWDCADSLWNDGVKVSGRSSFTSSNDTFECEPPVTPLKDDASIDFQSDDSAPVLHIFPSDFDSVSIESTLVLEDWEIISLQSEQDNVSLTSEESLTHDPGKKKKKKKKKKNCMRHFFSWMRKTFCCCVACVDDD
ncbi:uncharacterized protein LOC119023376 isoform X2 [Acanthopagrus latus]|uniref:uncharacterized protein LOC119023376 isoform X2 n=1 Tax=Acanthopagrus latus TaxID=8177 RepID=UPI00187C0A49|nr:uncharacterized protein LOC119023376 isoform X2 [Acanthopagrus latus]